MMRRFTFLTTLLSLMLFVACNDGELTTSDGVGSSMLRVELGAEGITSKADGDALNYIVQIYEAGSSTACYSTVITDESFEYEVAVGEGYECYFWACYDTSGYITSNLKSMVVMSAASAQEAWYGYEAFTASSEGKSMSVTLTRAVAEFSFYETGTISSGVSLVVGYDYPQVGYISADGFTIDSDSIVQSVYNTTTSATTGEIASLMILASTTSNTTTLEVSIGVDKKTLYNVPYQANYITKISGHYDFSVSSTNIIMSTSDWGGEDPTGEE